MNFKLTKKYGPEVIVANIIRILLILAALASIITQNWLNLFTAILTLVFTFFPSFLARNRRIYLPAGFQIAILLFIFCSLYLGELKQYYEKFWWWDLMLHTFSGIILGIIGFLLTYVLNREKKVNVILSPFFVALFSFTFAITAGALWEIYEFAMDGLFGFNMQKSGLVDTMWDLIVDTAGALLTSISGYMYMKYQQKSSFSRFIQRFLSKNPELFERKQEAGHKKDKEKIGTNIDK